MPTLRQVDVAKGGGWGVVGWGWEGGVERWGREGMDLGINGSASNSRHN